MESILRSIRLEAALVAILLVSQGAWAQDIGFRSGMGMGAWMSQFRQTDGTHESKVSSLTSMGLEAQFGANFSFIFLEYNLAWMISPYGANPKARDASYFSILGFNAGVDIPLLPIEVYTGVEKGNYKLNGGINPSYDGLAGKLGVNFYFAGVPGSKIRAGLKGEFRRVFINSDEAGSFPANISTQADTYFVGLMISG
jgi:hypothetical protein